MPNKTTNYKLNKPLANENIDISVLNDNMDIIDEELAKKSEFSGSYDDLTNKPTIPDVSGKADTTALTTHTGNSDIHVTASQKTAWSGKYSKPSAGIPKNDLASEVQASLNAVADKSNKPTFSQYTILTSGWSGGVYSFESDFPSATYDIEIELDSTATEPQVEAWSSAKVTSVFGTNTMKALGDVPTVDIPVIVKAVMK